MTRFLLFLFMMTCYDTSYAQLRAFPGSPKPMTAKQEALERKRFFARNGVTFGTEDEVDTDN